MKWGASCNVKQVLREMRGEAWGHLGAQSVQRPWGSTMTGFHPLHSLWDLSSPTRDQTCDPWQWKHQVLTTGPPGKYPCLVFWRKLSGPM